MSKRRATPEAPPARPFNDPFARLRERLPEPPSGAGAGPTAPPPEAAAPARAVVRLERKGRGGKEATVIEKLALSPSALEGWANALKRALGCGGCVEGDALVVQGDQRERVARWLEARGVRKVVRA